MIRSIHVDAVRFYFAALVSMSHVEQFLFAEHSFSSKHRHQSFSEERNSFSRVFLALSQNDERAFVLHERDQRSSEKQNQRSNEEQNQRSNEKQN
jgi:hypothetical protein